MSATSKQRKSNFEHLLRSIQLRLSDIENVDSAYESAGNTKKAVELFGNVVRINPR